MACKPGSVPRGRSPGWMTIHLGPVSLPASCSQPERRPEIAPVIHCLKTIRQYDRSFLFGFAPGGVYRDASHCWGAGALLPHPFTLADSLHAVGGLLSVALSLGLPPPGVIWHRDSMEPGLSSLQHRTDFAKRPSSHLTGPAYRGFCLKVKFLSCQPPCRAVRWFVTHITSTLVETRQNRL